MKLKTMELMMMVTVMLMTTMVGIPYKTMTITERWSWYKLSRYDGRGNNGLNVVGANWDVNHGRGWI